jgi:Mrp family chromosome partitioning ATPase
MVLPSRPAPVPDIGGSSFEKLATASALRGQYVSAGHGLGTGKTTVSYLVAETLSRAGKEVAIRDDDPQASR